MAATQARVSTVSFSGAGHLLVYHLGCSLEILRRVRKNKGMARKRDNKVPSFNTSTAKIPPIKAVAGSSSGAIAAVLLSKLPHRIEEFAEIFINTRGRALETLASMLHDEERRWLGHFDENGSEDMSVMNTSVGVGTIENRLPILHVATTACNDGSPYLFHFSNNEMYSTISSSWDTDRILETVKASCTIPPSFHPIDLVPSRLSWNHELYYPNEEGICIEGKYYVDGGIAAPAPKVPTPTPKEEVLPIIVSPVSFGTIPGAGGCNDLFRISPEDNSWRLLPCRNVKCRGNFLVKPSVQNLRTLRVAGGMASSAELRDWFERGMEDAKRMIDGLKLI